MSNHDQPQRAPEDATEELVASTMYEQNNSSEEELEVIINGQTGTSFSRTTPDEFSDTGDEDGLVYEIKALAGPTVKLCAVNVTGDQQAPDNYDSRGGGGGEEEEGEEPQNIATGAREEVTFRRPSTAEKRKRPIDDHEEEVCIYLSIVVVVGAQAAGACLSVLRVI